ncbi:Predicted arabinose efflux permease, MFS family [Nonomuraea solani]|uniref:Predicted arabinose efflux permease, MFS family n=1 Tax=Nonomuraea solani TaxID=1144553 RepID=A0A1H6EQH3_9ACTN|nr:MFS transporter [Nonomuraea solani]SEH00062.1 Predicted arabinose efflux permease, MFS family [Nonomuraea solani]
MVWSGQVITLVGNSVLRFSLIIQAWTVDHQATQVVALSLCALLPQVLLSPTAGALVDRLRKRTALQLADLGGLVAVGAMTAVYFLGDLHLWLVYVTVALLGAAAAFQYPALSSAVPLLVDKEQLQRANGLLATAKSVADVGGPALAGLLVVTGGLGAVLWVDLVSFAVALLTVRIVRMDGDSPGEAGTRKRLGADSLEGLRYLFGHPGLRGLILVFFTVNLVMVFGFAVVQPMILARTGSDVSALAGVNAGIGVGGIAGGLLLAAWGGPKNRVRGMMLGVVGMCVSAQIVMSMVHGVVAWTAAILVGALIMPIVNGTLQSIIQTKVPKERQGRVFGAVLFVSQISSPLAMACSGPLADHVFEPQAAAGTGLAGLLRPFVGTGPGSGMAAMLLIAGLLGSGAALWGLARRAIRHIDVLTPDLEKQPAKG